jgi:hypothetical protein
MGFILVALRPTFLTKSCVPGMEPCVDSWPESTCNVRRLMITLYWDQASTGVLRELHVRGRLTVAPIFIQSYHKLLPEREKICHPQFRMGIKQSQSRDSSVCIALGYGLDGRDSGVRFPVGTREFFLHHRVQNGSEVYPASYPIGTRGSFPGGKAAGV